MECYEIDAQCLYNAFLSGNNEIFMNKNLLDKINVFPVADGDTGTNLALTLSAIDNSRIYPSAGETIKAMVDAGAEGFFLFLKGFTYYFTLGRKAVVEAEEAIEMEIPPHTHDAEYPQYRYCTEAYIKDSQKSNAEIRDELQAFGDSLIVAGSGDSRRIHIHTDTPAEVFRILTEHSRIAEQKVDDMIREYQ